MLDIKYRPTVFSEVVGQQHHVKILKRIIEGPSCPDPVLFFGPWGSGKTTMARIYAKSILCQNRSDGEPCNTCDSCRSFSAGSHQAYQEIDGANVSKVDDFRDLLDSLTYVVPGVSRRVILIDECHRMSDAAQSVLLKPLEENEYGVVWVFCTNEYRKMLPTIKSRCMEFGVKVASSDELMNHLRKVCEREHLPYSITAIRRVVSQHDGHIRDMLKFMDKALLLGALSDEMVYEQFGGSVDDSCLSILLSIKEDVKESIALTEQAVDQYGASLVYTRLHGTIINLIKLRLGMSVYDGDSLVKANLIIGKIGKDLSKLLRQFTKSDGVLVDKWYILSWVVLMFKELPTVDEKPKQEQPKPAQGVSLSKPKGFTKSSELTDSQLAALFQSELS